MIITNIKKRNGDIVKFEPKKIGSAIQKAFIAVRGGIEDAKLKEIADLTLAELGKKFDGKVPSVEDVQDITERAIMQAGFFDVARSYIVYRYEHTKIREQKKEEILEKIEKKELFVTKRNGKTEKFNPEKIRKTLTIAAKSYEKEIDIDEITKQCEAGLYEGIKTAEIFKLLMYTVRAFIERDPAYSKVAARLLAKTIYKRVIGDDAVNFDNLDKQYRETFISHIKKGIDAKKLDAKMAEFDLERLAKELKPERDDLFEYLGMQTIADRYLLQISDKKVLLETPQAFWMRVAMGLAIAEKDKNDWAVKFYEVLSSLRYVASTPTLFHAGTSSPQLSSCYLNTVMDSLDHIFKVISDNAQLSKWSGGLGTDWTNLRATGAYIKGIGVESQGIVPFLKVMNDTTAAINRSGRRRGAAVSYLETWHYDIEQYLDLRKNTGDDRLRTHDMDTANWIPDLFMKRVAEGGDWTLFSPDEVPELHHIYGKKFDEKYISYEKLAAEGKIRLTKKIPAKDLWKKMLAALYETGHPWITWKDAANVRSPQDHAGVIHCSNLCTEITLNTSAEETAVCNLGSVNLARHVENGKFNKTLVQETVTMAMRMLDNVIDINFYPTIEGKNSNMKHRPVGLGIMGFQDALYQLDVDFASDACVDFADESMEVISYYAIQTSSNLAKERGTYASYKGSKWDRGIFPMDTLDLLETERGVRIEVPRTGRMDWNALKALVKAQGMRNSNTMACAPTATISNIAGCLPTIEPIYKNLYVKSNQGGDFTILNEYLVKDLKKVNMWNADTLSAIKYYDGSIAEIVQIPEKIRNKYKEVFDIDSKWLVKAAAYRGKWIDQAQSLNLYFRGTSGSQLGEVYMYAWKMGIKTTYYLRTLAASQVEKSTVAPSAHGTTHNRNANKKVEDMLPTPQHQTAPAMATVAVASQAAVSAPTPIAPPLPSQVSGGNLGGRVTIPTAPRVKILKNDLGEDAICEGCQ